MKTYTVLLLSLLLSACSIFKKQQEVENLWVNSSKVKCTGVGPTSCLQIQHGDSLNSNWENHYSSIEGFEFEPGYIYKLSVKKVYADNKNNVQDKSTFKYVLVEIVEKEKDHALLIHDIYIVSNLDGIGEIKDLDKAPTMEINTTKNAIGGKDGCNSYGGDIKTLNKDQIEFGAIFATKMYCENNMAIPNQLHKSLGEVKFYQRKDGYVFLLNAERKSIITLKKVD